MDTWKFYDITHRDHVVCNPTSEEKLTRLVELLRLTANARVVDIACAGITFTQMNGADFKPDEPHSLDLASCIGASWVFGGHANTLEALISMVRGLAAG